MNFIRLDPSNSIDYHCQPYSCQSDEKSSLEIQKSLCASSAAAEEKVILNLHSNPNEEKRRVSTGVATKDQPNT